MITAGKSVSPDGEFLVGFLDDVAALYPLKGGPPVPIRGIDAGDRPIQWSPDGRSLYLKNGKEPGKIWLLEISSAKKRLFREVGPKEPWLGPAGGWLQNVFITPDGTSYVTSFTGFLADLFVLDGLK
jgi:hypothetical protein